MQTVAQFKEKKKMIQSIGVYYRDESTQHIGYWEQKELSQREFISVCIIPINSPFQNAIIESIKNQLQ